MEGRPGKARWDEIATASGIVFAVLGFVAFLLTGRPEAGASGEEVVEFFVEHETAIEWQAFLFGLAALAFLWFAGRLAGLLRGAGGEPADRIPEIVLAGASASTALFLAGVGSFAALAQTSGEQGATRALFDLGDMAFGLSSFTAAVFVEGAAVGILRTRLLPRWMGLLGTMLVSLLLVNAAVRLFSGGSAGATLGTVSFLALLAWVLLVSGSLTLRGARGGTAAARAG